MNIKKNIWNIIWIPFILCSCMYFQKNRTVKLIINPENSGWYFVQLIQDSTISDTGTVVLKFDGKTRLLKAYVHDIQKTIVSPFDKNGNNISDRLKYTLIREDGNNNFFQFYNPTDEELANIKKWNPTDKRADEIMSLKDIEFNKYYKE